MFENTESKIEPREGEGTLAFTSNKIEYEKLIKENNPELFSVHGLSLNKLRSAPEDAIFTETGLNIEDLNPEQLLICADITNPGQLVLEGLEGLEGLEKIQEDHELPQEYKNQIPSGIEIATVTSLPEKGKLKTILDQKMNRREFLKFAAVATAATNLAFHLPKSDRTPTIKSLRLSKMRMACQQEIEQRPDQKTAFNSLTILPEDMATESDSLLTPQIEENSKVEMRTILLYTLMHMRDQYRKKSIKVDDELIEQVKDAFSRYIIISDNSTQIREIADFSYLIDLELKGIKG